MKQQTYTVRELRERFCLTQAQLAAKADLHPATVLRVEHSRHVPELTTRARLAQALGWPPERINWQPPAA